jgi:hypothetical protein
MVGIQTAVSITIAMSKLTKYDIFRIRWWVGGQNPNETHEVKYLTPKLDYTVNRYQCIMGEQISLYIKYLKFFGTTKRFP